MINAENPNFTLTPISDKFPVFTYKCGEVVEPLVSIITPYYNIGSIFLETVKSIQNMSFPYWEWIIVNDGSTKLESIRQLEELVKQDQRVKITNQSNSGPGVARNKAVAMSSGKYVLQLDGDDLVEPTFLEKALWVLEMQPQFSACNSHSVTFGIQNKLWHFGFQQYKHNLYDNYITNQAVIVREHFLQVGGYDESISYEHADWDFWLKFAESGFWGFTIKEYLTWYRTQQKSLLTEIEKDTNRSVNFARLLRKKHCRLQKTFPHTTWEKHNNDTEIAQKTFTLPFKNLLDKPVNTKRLLMIVPWLEVGGADRFNHECIRMLQQYNYQITIVTTVESTNYWLVEFSLLTSDIFCLSHFLNPLDYPRFISYIIESRQIDAIMISNSEIGYHMSSFLKEKYPKIPLIDYLHMEEMDWNNGGYPRQSVIYDEYFDLHITATQYLKDWMINQGSQKDKIAVCRCNIDTEKWNPDLFDRSEIRRSFSIPQDTIVILFIGRIVEQKRPLLFVEIIRELSQQLSSTSFVAIIVGDGPLIPKITSFVHQHNLKNYIRLQGIATEHTIQELLVAGDILLLPSKQEGLALILYESMSMATVPIAAKVGGQHELVDNSCGVLVPHSNHEFNDYVQYLKELIQNTQLRTSMSHNARKRINESFDIQQMGQCMAEILRNAIDQRHRNSHIVKPSIQNENSLYDYLVDVEKTLEPFKSLQQTPTMIGYLRVLKEILIPNGSKRYTIYRYLRSSLHLSKR